MAPSGSKELSSSLRFGRFTLDLGRHGLYRGNRRLRLTGKPLETLIYLARNHGRVVTREVLLDAIWSGVYVTPNTLEHAIGEIRHVLADVKEKPQFIQTVSGIGYCFTSEVEEFPGPRELAGTRV